MDNWQKFQNFIANTPLGHAVSVFLGVYVATMAAQWANDGVISFDNWQSWFIAGFSAAAVVIANWLNPEQKQYGRKGKQAEDLVDVEITPDDVGA